MTAYRVLPPLHLRCISQAPPHAYSTYATNIQEQAERKTHAKLGATEWGPGEGKGRVRLTSFIKLNAGKIYLPVNSGL